MPGAIKGTGGIGQWDLGTANQDIRAATQPTPGRRAPMNEGLNPNPVYSWKGLGRKKGRKNPRNKSRSKRK